MSVKQKLFIQHLIDERPRVLSRCLYVVVALMMGNIFLAVTVAQQPQAGQVAFVADRTAEYNVKGAYLYNFARYVTWPESSDLPAGEEFHFGVLGDSGVLAPLQKIAKFKKISNRRTGRAQRIKLHHFATPEECLPCQILFVSESVSPEAVAAVLKKFSDVPVFVVGETAGFAQADGNAEFLLVAGGVRFDLNLNTAGPKQLKLDAKLLKAANSIVQNRPADSVTSTD